MQFPKLGMTVVQYLWCWAIVLLIHFTPEFQALVSGYYIYLYATFLSLSAIYLLIKFAGRTILAFAISTLESLAVLLQMPACWANIWKEPNYFHSNYRLILENLYQLEVTLLIIAGVYGFFRLGWNIYSSRNNRKGDSNFKSLVYPFFYERRRQSR